MLLPTFFPKRARPRTVVHAGRLLLERRGGERSLRRYLRLPRRREVLLVHRGHDSLRAVAREAGVTDIAVDTPEVEDASSATEMALALGARRLDFTIDEPGVPGPDGDPLGEIDLRDAERLARDPRLRPRIRAKLAAGCDALRRGVARVRIGHPVALTRNRATVLRPDPATAAATGASGSSSHARPTGDAPGEPASTADALHDPWWRLRALQPPRRSRPLLAA